MKFYDTLTKTAVFTSVRELLYGINCMSTRKVDEHSGHLTLRGLRFKDTEGVELSYTNPIEIFKGLKEDFSLPVDVSGCVRRGKVFRIKMTEAPYLEYGDMQQKVVIAQIEDVVEEASVEEDVIPVVVEEAIEIVTEEEVEPTESPEDVDWEWVNSLENKKYDKIKLDEYADEKFGIKLNRVMKIDNMIADLKEQLANK